MCDCLEVCSDCRKSVGVRFDSDFGFSFQLVDNGYVVAVVMLFDGFCGYYILYRMVVKC